MNPIFISNIQLVCSIVIAFAGVCGCGTEFSHAAQEQIRPGDRWSYFGEEATPPAAWNQLGFDAKAWPEWRSNTGRFAPDAAGPAVFIRKTFEVPDPDIVRDVVLAVDYNGGFLAYLNGSVVAGANVTGVAPSAGPDPRGELPSHDTPASGERETGRSMLYDIDPALLIDGSNVLALQGHNRTLRSSDLSLDPELASNAELYIRSGDSWRYFIGDRPAPADWKELGFNDGGWQSGPGGFGYGDDDDGTVLDTMQDEYLSVYIRKTFNVSDRRKVSRLILSVNYDDGFVAYLNGRLITTANVAGSAPSYLAEADGYRHPGIAMRYQISPQGLVKGTNVLALQGHRAGGDDTALVLLPSLTVLETEPYHLVGAGDIAGCLNGREENTAELVERALTGIRDDHARAFTAGDNAYEDGSREDFERCYDPTWGRFRPQTWPSVGNHDYGHDGDRAGPYYQYFADAAAPAPGQPGKGYYQTAYGGWNVIVLNSCESAGDRSCTDSRAGFSQTQLDWLDDKLASACTLVIWHHPKFSPGSDHDHNPSSSISELWQKLYENNADMILNGHTHLYARYSPLNPAGDHDPERGISAFIVGSGGRPIVDAAPDRLPAPAFVYHSGNGGQNAVLEIRLYPEGYAWRLRNIRRQLIDWGADSCH